MTKIPGVHLSIILGFLIVASISLMGCYPLPEIVATVTPGFIQKKSATEIFTPDPPYNPNINAIATSAPNSSPIPAFQGAEGFGTETAGGRGGKVIEVKNLNDS